ncbi:EscU/YscU/HrcU family type III secretion system export apparatus switch protein [Neptunomonas japonica]|uniref:EscU/YscU/HrcU family type III secretion system export apparatus switch protein n=1 Tax=Neptunomonas japonica TaxID=417574 RepID=UPI000420F526|nr:EscU/YscU/HrcU family type III secretion system export apparatus switch protein [Neptunomonas japonica]
MKDEDKNASAIALKYNRGTATAPTIVAKGKGEIAQQILALANEHEIHVHQSPELLEVLIRLEIGEEIPEALYKAIAEVIAFAYKLKNKN